MGTKDRLNPSRMRFIVILGLFGLLLLMVYNLEPRLKEASQSKNKGLGYLDIVDDLDNCIGKTTTFSGEVLELIDKENELSIRLRVNVSEDIKGDNEKVSNSSRIYATILYKTELDLYEELNIGDRITVTGEITGVASYNDSKVPILVGNGIEYI